MNTRIHLLEAIIAHPNYLEVRMYGEAADGRFGLETRKPLPLGPDLLQDLAALYRG